MATAEEARAARDAKLDALHEQLTDAVGQLVSGEDWRRAIEFAAKFRTRSLSNSLLIGRQHVAAFEAGRVPDPEPSYVAGYKQWQTLGRQVLKGQPGYMILAPVTGRFATTTPADADSWRRLGKFEKPRPGEVVRSRMVGVRPAYVWDASSTTGDTPAPGGPRTPTRPEPSPMILRARVRALCAGWTPSASTGTGDSRSIDSFPRGIKGPGSPWSP